MDTDGGHPASGQSPVQGASWGHWHLWRYHRSFPRPCPVGSHFPAEATCLERSSHVPSPFPARGNSRKGRRRYWWALERHSISQISHYLAPERNGTSGHHFGPQRLCNPCVSTRVSVQAGALATLHLISPMCEMGSIIRELAGHEVGAQRALPGPHSMCRHTHGCARSLGWLAGLSSLTCKTIYRKSKLPSSVNVLEHAHRHFHI